MNKNERWHHRSFFVSPLKPVIRITNPNEIKESLWVFLVREVAIPAVCQSGVGLDENGMAFFQEEAVFLAADDQCGCFHARAVLSIHPGLSISRAPAYEGLKNMPALSVVQTRGDPVNRNSWSAWAGHPITIYRFQWIKSGLRVSS